MATTTIVRITHPETSAQLSEFAGSPATAPREAALRASKYLRALAIGVGAGSATFTIGADDSVAASATATFSGVVATDSISINGTAFACVNSGATNNQFNKGADDAASAVNCAAKINAISSTVLVTASAAAGVITLTALHSGVLGNAITIAQSGNHITLDPTSGRLEGGLLALG
jgi:phage tail sheath gpL-like